MSNTKEMMGEMLIAAEAEIEAAREALQAALQDKARAEGALLIEQTSRARAEAALDTERAARIAAEAARATAEQRAVPQPSPVTTVVETARKPGKWQFEIHRDGAQQIARVVAIPEEKK